MLENINAKGHGVMILYREYRDAFLLKEVHPKSFCLTFGVHLETLPFLFSLGNKDGGKCFLSAYPTGESYIRIKSGSGVCNPLV